MVPLGAHPSARGTTFAVFATTARAVAVRIADRGGMRPLEPRGDGLFTATFDDVSEGALYEIVLDGAVLPDPYARALPFGVHGPARVVAPAREPALARPPEPHRWTIYELHVGTFTAEGTFRAAIERLDALVDLGVSAIEIMPVAAFAGERGWGYDGVALFAPHAPYGEPEDLRALVRAAHARGLAVILDVVYNHFGPAGNYLARFSPSYFDEETKTPWGAAPDFAHAPMRRLAIENARYWLEEFGFDGLRLDATHAIVDRSARHVVAEITDVARAMSPPRAVWLEDERNDPRHVLDAHATGQWADDLHHQLHVLATGERDGYYAAYEPTASALARCIREGWAYTGQPYVAWQGRPRGAPATALRPEQLVTCIQNHDQVGNRALGDRLEADRLAACAMVVLFLPTTPLLFMGQEWAASAPFLYFSDHEGELGEAVTRGRRREFEAFAAFRHAEVPDPQARATFERSKLDWSERTRPPHARVLALHRAMLRLRREDPVLSAPATWSDLDARAEGGVLEVTRRHGGATRRLVANFGDVEALVDGRILVASRELDGGLLPPWSAIVLDE